MIEKFDAVIVGAGPAGLMAAYHLASEGLRALVIERGDYPGSKNVSGALLHTHGLADLFPDFAKQAPLERIVTSRKLVFMTEGSSLAIDFRDESFSEPPAGGFTVLRSKFDPWLAAKAEEAGALIMTGTLVEDLLWDGARVAGVRTDRDDGEVKADVVIIAEGANSLLTGKAGLRGEQPPAEMAVAAKEIVKLSREVVNERFNLRGGEGASVHFIGDCTKGIPGGGFIYTNRDSVSLGLVCRVAGLAERRLKISELIESFKAHPHVRPLIEGGVAREYSGHMIPEGGFKSMPKLFAAGVLVVGEAASLNFNNGFILRGIDYAMASGQAAAKAVVSAKERGDFSEQSLSSYRRELEDTFVLKDMKRFQGLPELLSNPRIFSTYPAILCGLGRESFSADGEERGRAIDMAREVIRRQGGEVGIGRIILDLISMGTKL